MARKYYAKEQKTTTKNWEGATLRLPKDLMVKIRKDAFDNLRPIGLHIGFVIKKYLEKKERRNK